MRNLVVLVCAQFFAACGHVSMVVLASIVGAGLAPDTSLATLPVTCAVLGVAAATVPAALAMQRFGRRSVFVGGTLIATAGGLLASQAIDLDRFWQFCAGTALMGCNLAITAQYRFAAAESVAGERVSRAVAWVMLGTVGAAALAPQLAVALRYAVGAEYTGSFLAMAGAYLCGGACLLSLRLPAPAAEDRAGDGRPLAMIARQPVFRVAVLTAAAGYGVMALIMTATPLSMHVIDGHPVRSTALVVQAHVLAMYLPSLLSGTLVARLGAGRMVALGLLLESSGALIALSGHRASHYGLAMVSLGVGWNLMFVAATTLLTRSYQPQERFRVQALNEFAMFGVMASASLLAGLLLAGIGWRGLNLASLLVLLLVGLTLARVGRRIA